MLFTLIAERYEWRSLRITSNLIFSEWERIFANPMATAAAIDRVVHHSVIMEFNVPSYRADAAQQRGQEQEINRQNWLTPDLQECLTRDTRLEPGKLVSDFYAGYHHYYPGRPSTRRTPSWPGGQRQSTNSTLWGRTSPIRRRGNGGWSKSGRSGNCWPSAARSGMTHRRSRASSADASNAILRNCLSLWLSRPCHPTTTPPNGACGIWRRAARSAAAPARCRAPIAG